MHLLIFSFIPILSRLVANVANSAIVKTIIVPTFSLRRTLSRIGILKEKIVVIPSAIDKIQPSDILSKEDFQRYRSRLGLDLDDFVITYFGPPCTLRGIDTIVFSLREILKQFRNVKALFLFRKGSKENFWLMQEREKEHLSKTVRKLNLDDYVVMVQGNLSKQTLRNCIRMSDIIVLPFKLLLTEFPLSVLEALALNKTVVTTNIGSLPELTKGSGILVSPSKPSELAATILRMIRQRGKDGQPEQHAQCSYPWDWTKLASLVKDLSERIHKASVRDELSQNLYQRLVLKQKWQIWKKSPLDAYRRLRRRIAYKLFGIRTFDVQTDENLPNLGIDEFGRQVTQGLLFYSGLLRIRGVALHTIVVLGSRAKGRWSPKSDVDVLIIADEIPNRHRRGPIFSDVPIFLGIRPDIFTPSELLSELGCLNTKILDAVYYGKVVYDDGFWSVVNQRVKQFEAEFSLDETHLKEIIHAL
jgi:glycosyltransferase involved in cell wall biosynthesis/predicted nucleotidyltransferase